MTDESLSTIWSEFNTTLVQLDVLQHGCFTDSLLLINDIKAQLTDANAAYSTASKTVNEWIGVAQPLLSIHSLAQKGTAHKKIIDKSLNFGITKLGMAQQELEKISLAFEPIMSSVRARLVQSDDEFSEKQKCFQSKLKILRAALGSVDRIEKELIPKIVQRIEAYQKFRNDLGKRIQHEFQNIENMKAKLREEIQSIGDVKINIEPVRSAMNDMESNNNDHLNKTVKELVENCKKYRKTHEK